MELIEYDQEVKQMIQSVDRATQILELLLDKSSLSLTEISHEMQLSKSTVSGLVSTLECKGYLERQPQSLRYVLGPMLLRLGASYSKRLDYKNLAHEHLAALCEQTGMTVNMAILNGTNVIYLDNLNPEGMVVLETKAGSVMPAHCVATGKALLAQLSDDELITLYQDYQFERYTPRTILSLHDLMVELSMTRERGYAIDNFESDARTFGVSMVVRDAYGNKPFAISAGGVAADRDLVISEHNLALLRQTIEQITQRLGA